MRRALAGLTVAVFAVVLAATAEGDAGPRVVVRTAAGDEVAGADAGRGFALAYRHSVYRVPAEERFRAAAGGGFDLVEIASPSEAVLDYYALDGRKARRGVTWVLRPARPPHFSVLALAGTRVGRRTLVAAGRRTPLWRPDGRAAHLRITVTGR